MARYKDYLHSDKALDTGLIRESRHLIGTELDESKTEKELIELLRKYKLGDKKNIAKIRKYVVQFATDVNGILHILEKARRAGLRDEYNKLVGLRDLLFEQKKFKFTPVQKKLLELEKKVEEHMKQIIEDILRNTRRTKLHRAPRGYYLRRGASARALAKDIRRGAAQERMNIGEESHLLGEIKHLISDFQAQPVHIKLFKWKKRLNQLEKDIMRLLKHYEEDFEYVYRVEVELDIEQVRKLHQIDLVVDYLKRINEKELNSLIPQLEHLKELADYWVSQDYSDEHRMDVFIKKCEDILREISLPHALDAKTKASLESFYAFMNRPFKEEDLVFVHITNFFPYRGVMRSRLSNVGDARDTLHFTVNGPVSPVNAGLSDWSNMKFAILIPLTQFPLDKLENFAMMDSFIIGSLFIPKGSLIIGKRRDLIDAANHENMSLAELVDFFNKRYIRLMVLGDDKSPYEESKEIIVKSGRFLQKLIGQWQNESSFDDGMLRSGALLSQYGAGERSKEFARKIGATSIAHNYSESHDLEQLQQLYAPKMVGNTFDSFKKERFNESSREAGWHVQSLFRLWGDMPKVVHWLNNHVNEKKYQRSNSLLLNHFYDFLVFSSREFDSILGYLQEYVKRGVINNKEFAPFSVWFGEWHGTNYPLYKEHLFETDRRTYHQLTGIVIGDFRCYLRDKLSFSDEVKRKFPNQIRFIEDTAGKIIRTISEINRLYREIEHLQRKS